MENKQFDDNKDLADNKHLAELYHNMYIDCIKYKNKKNITDNKIDCDTYLNSFRFFSEKYNNDNNRNI